MEAFSAKYRDTVLQYFEEEIMGEAYFYTLASHFSDPAHKKKLTLMAEVERFAAEAMRPLLAKYNLTPRDEADLAKIGKDWVGRHEVFDWETLVTDIAVRYPEYTAEFRALEKIAPNDDLPLLKILTDHEVVVVEFAEMELQGNAKCLDPIYRYLEIKG